MFSGHRLHVVGSNNTEYQYPIFDSQSDIPTGMSSIKYQIDANTTGYIKALPESQYPVAGLHIKDNNRIITAFNNNTLNCNLQWHWDGRSGPYSVFRYICPDSATLDFGIHTDLEIIVLWHTTNIGWQSATVGTIPAGATSITMSGQYGGQISGSSSTLVTAWYFLVRSKVAYRQISGHCVYTMVSATINANVHLSEPLPVGHIYLYGDWYGLLPPFSAHFGGYDVMGTGAQDGNSVVSFDAMLGLAPTNYYTFLRYFPETGGAYGSVDFVGRGWAPAGGGQFTDNFTLSIPTAASQDIGTTPQYGVSSSDTGYNISIPEAYW